jgi:hypothetical protein
MTTTSITNDTETFYVVAEECAEKHVNITPQGRSGVVRGFLYNSSSYNPPSYTCTFSITAPG